MGCCDGDSKTSPRMASARITAARAASWIVSVGVNFSMMSFSKVVIVCFLLLLFFRGTPSGRPGRHRSRESGISIYTDTVLASKKT